MTKLMMTVALAAVAGMAPRGARANDGAKTEVPLLRGKSAHARFESSKDCVTTVVTVQIDDDRTQTLAGAKEHLKDATISVEQFFDPALGTACERLDPVVQDSDVTITNPNILIEDDLEVARLHGEARLFDAKNARFRAVKFDLRWRSKGKKQKTKTREQRTEGNKVIVVEDEVEVRAAEASGSLKEGKINYTPRPSRIADTNIKSEELSQTTRKK
jgi:hypothetical protein